MAYRLAPVIPERLVEAGELRTTLGEDFGRINAANLKRTHALLESGKAGRSCWKVSKAGRRQQ
jgi:hypothetical protein